MENSAHENGFEKEAGMDVGEVLETTLEEEDPIAQHYEKKPEEDYLKILQMIESEKGCVTRTEIMEELQIPGDVLEAFFDVALRECISDPERQNFICDRLVQIQGDRVPEIAKKLKLQSFKLQDEVRALKALKKDYDEKLKELARLQEIIAAGGGEKGTSNVSELESECEILQERIQGLEENEKTLLDQLQEFKEKNNSDETDGANEIERLRGEVFELEQNKDDLESKIRDLQAKIEENGGGNDQEHDEARIRELEEQLETMENDKRVLQGKVFALAEQLEESELNGGPSQEIDSLREQIDGLQQARRQDKEMIEELQEKLEDLEAEKENSERLSKKNNNLFESQEEKEPETKRVKADKKTGVNIWLVMIGVVAVLAILFFVVVKVSTPTEVAPVQGEPTPVAQTNQAPLSAPLPTQAIPMSNEQVQQAPLPTQALPVASVVSTLNTPDDFRRAALETMKINEMGELVIDTQAYKPGEMINGFKLILVQKSFIRLQDTKTGLQFRVDMGV